jgi:UDP-N-acetylglucosamine 4,6-dehydratase
MFSGQTILVTGGTGTFGNAVAQRCIRENVREIRIFSRDELKQEMMRNELRDPRVKFFLGDVRNPNSLVAPMEGVDYVFHAAALKQVPSCEFFPLEAVMTNILGAENVFSTAISSGVKVVVALSTDKAAYPINAMGMSKALMEKIMIAKSRMQTSTVLCGTRYGNVLASRGSVVPLFVTQIKAGQPLTVTNPDMTRCLMTIEEAVDLVFHAFQKAQSGDIFVKKVPAATMLAVAEALQEIFGVKRDIKIIGTRHGEKLYEVLITREEMVKSEDSGGYYRIPMDARDMNYSLYSEEGQKNSTTEYTSQNTYRLGKEEIVHLLQQLDCVKAARRSHEDCSNGRNV